MANFASAQTQAKKFAKQNDLSSDVQQVRENIKDLGDSVGHIASRQYNALRTWRPTRSKEPAMQFNVTRLPLSKSASALVLYSAWRWVDAIKPAAVSDQSLLPAARHCVGCTTTQQAGDALHSKVGRPVAARLKYHAEDNSMRLLIALLVIIYLVGVGVVLAPTIEANWSTAYASQLVGSVATELPRALSWPATVYRSIAKRG